MLLLSMPTLALAQTPLTLAEAQRLAVVRSRMPVAQDAAASAAREMAVAAGQLPDPVATVGINNLPINGPDQFSVGADFMTMRSVGLMQEFTRTGKRDARTARFQREADQAQAEKEASVAIVQRETAIAWLDRYYAEAMLAVLAEQRSQATAEVDAAEGAYRAGRGTLADLLGARSALAMLDDRNSEVRRKASTARIALARWIRADADTPLAGTPSIDSLQLDANTLDVDIGHHAELAVMARKEDVAAAEVRVAEAAKQADFTVALMYSQRGPAYSNMVSLNVSVPLQWDQANRQDREVAAKLAMLDKVRAEREDMQRAHAAEVRAMLVEWASDRERRLRFEHEVLPLATERTVATLAAFRGAKASIGDVLLARTNEIDVRLQALQLDMDTARLWAQLNFLVPDDSVRPAGAHAKDMP